LIIFLKLFQLMALNLFIVGIQFKPLINSNTESKEKTVDTINYLLYKTITQRRV